MAVLHSNLEFQIAQSFRAYGTGLLEKLLEESIGALSGGGVFAWANRNGIRLLFDDTAFEDFLSKANFDLMIGTDAVTDESAIDALLARADAFPTLSARAFVTGGKALFHPKLAWFEHDDYLSLIVGSGNLTMGGLRSNWEAHTVTRMDGDDRDVARESIASFFESQTDFLFDIKDPLVRRAVQGNSGNERRIGHSFHRQNLSDSEIAADGVLIAEVPKASSRWSQVNFDAESYTEFFGAKIGVSTRVIFRHVGLDGEIDEPEVRQSVEVLSKNYRFELAAAKGIAYPPHGSPIAVFCKLVTGEFLYTLLLPDDDDFSLVSTFMSTLWTGSSHRKIRVRTSLSDLHEAWPSSPFNYLELPPL